MLRMQAALVHTFEYLNRGSAKVFHIIFFSAKQEIFIEHIRELEMHQAEKVNIYNKDTYVYGRAHEKK